MTSTPLRIVVVDDSALFRQMLQNVARSIPGVEVVGTAANGVEAVEVVERCRPDALTLDIQMPVKSGIDVLRELRQRRNPARAIMVSSLTAPGAQATVEALMEGAFDFVLKPAGVDPHVGRAQLVVELAAKFDAVRGSIVPAPAAVASPTPRPTAAVAADGFAAVVIGTSTGGPEALRVVIPGLSAGLGVPVFVVQHIPPMFSATLAARLDAMSAVSVVEAADGMPAEPGRVHVAPGGHHLVVRRQSGRLVCGIDDGAARLGCRPSVDVLLESLVQAAGSNRILAVILTGMGADGTSGCAAVKAHGGQVIVQAREGCTVWGMPKSVQERGLCDAVEPLPRIAAAVHERLATHPRWNPDRDARGATPGDAAAAGKPYPPGPGRQIG